MVFFFFFFQAEDGIRDAQDSRGLGDVYKRQVGGRGVAVGRVGRGVGSSGASSGKVRSRYSPASGGPGMKRGTLGAVGVIVAMAGTRSTRTVTATTTAPASEMVGGGGAEASLLLPQPRPARIISAPIMVRALARAGALFVKSLSLIHI